MAKIDKQSDAVQMMSSIRDRISKEISGMSFEEEQAYIQERLRDESIARFCTDSEATPRTDKVTEGEGGN